MSIKIQNLTVSYNFHPAVHHLNATINQGQWLAVVGPNGAGKSTLLNVLAGIITEYEGSIKGINPNNVAYLPQQTKLDKDFPITVLELISTGLWQEIGFSGGLSDTQIERCMNALEAVGLDGFENRIINTLSGGQLQRSLFARVLMQDQQVILLDEPFNAIDTKTLTDLTSVIKEWQNKNRTIIMVTHDLEYVKDNCPTSMLLAKECIDLGSTKSVLTKENLDNAKKVSEAFDENSAWCIS
jgi:zinc/manganese transport system ATP-binding protein